jgi:hypothetical protein
MVLATYARRSFSLVSTRSLVTNAMCAARWVPLDDVLGNVILDL